MLDSLVADLDPPLDVRLGQRVTMIDRAGTETGGVAVLHYERAERAGQTEGRTEGQTEGQTVCDLVVLSGPIPTMVAPPPAGSPSPAPV